MDQKAQHTTRATGGYQHKLVIALTNDEIRVNVANPTHIRYFAKSKGCLSKTDKIDAKIIAQFAAERKPEPTQIPTENERALKEFVALLRQLVRQRMQFKNQIEHATQKEAVAVTKSLIEHITKRIKKSGASSADEAA